MSSAADLFGFNGKDFSKIRGEFVSNWAYRQHTLKSTGLSGLS